MGCPGGAEESEGIDGQGDVPVFGTLPPLARDLEALASDGRDLEDEGCMEPEAHARDGGEGDLVVQGGRRGEEPLHLLHTEDGGETVCGLRADE